MVLWISAPIALKLIITRRDFDFSFLNLLSFVYGCCKMCESREILLDASDERDNNPEVIIDAAQLEAQHEFMAPPYVSRFDSYKPHVFFRSQSWSTLGIIFCVFYNCFILVILLLSFIHSKLAH
nr:uncharacterized protein LOC116651585 [Drosophila virilis]